MTPLAPLPKGAAAFREFYGFHSPQHVDDAGHATKAWESRLMLISLPAPLSLSWDRWIHVRQVRLHPQCASHFDRFLREVYAEGLWQFLDPFGGGYAWRLQRGSAGALSTHAFGAALDFDPAGNPRGRAIEDCRMPRDVVNIARAVGLACGADFATIDVMHFQAGEEW